MHACHPAYLRGFGAVPTAASQASFAHSADWDHSEDELADAVGASALRQSLAVPRAVAVVALPAA